MVESLQMFLFLFKSKYRRKYSWFSPFLCSVLIVLLFCHSALSVSKCGEHNCINGVCRNETCVCFEGWKNSECQHCTGKVKLTAPVGTITDGPGNYSVSNRCSWLIAPPSLGPSPPPLRVRLESFATECGWDHLYIYDGDSVRASKLLAIYSVSNRCSWLIAPPSLGPSPPPLRVRLESFATECGWDHLYIYDGDSVRASKLLAIYSVSNRCSWLIAPPSLGPSPPPLRVRLESFATECGWDHLYIYDGDSVRASKLLAIYSVSNRCSWLIAPPSLGPSPPPLRVRLESFATECGWDHLYIYDGDSVRASKLLAIYSVSNRCSWLIAPPSLGPSPPPLRVRLESFATECGWDHLYIYDGDSVRASKLLAIYSGVLESTDSSWTRQVIARSGSALLHFFSDDAYAMEGFNLTYAAYSCPSNDHRTNCSNHGECDDGTCRCDPDWIGVACDQPLCPDDCNSEYGAGTCTDRGCECTPSKTGADCSRDASTAGWGWAWREEGEELPPLGGHRGVTPPGVAGHSLLVYEGDLLRVGGETFQHSSFLYRYRVATKTWEEIKTRGEEPAPRYAHSAVIYGHELIVYGGTVTSFQPERGSGLAGSEGRADEATNEVWRIQLDSSTPQWVNATPTDCVRRHEAPLKHCGGLHLSGHTAVLVRLGNTRRPVMLVFFGHSPHYGYLHIVQEYYLEDNAWVSVATSGWPARAGFAHSAVWDELTRRVYVHGGLVSESEATQAPSSELYEYDVDNKIWRPLPSAPTPRYLHTAVFVSPGIMLVFGGNAHNDSAASGTSNPVGAKCYSSDAMLYDVR
ncbi:galactose oxidase, central domain-containing protein [Phthorimaea operculella]|nr:galactose oxidase, central domain-containing protein [Phthorimaea operculella]